MKSIKKYTKRAIFQQQWFKQEKNRGKLLNYSNKFQLKSILSCFCLHNPTQTMTMLELSKNVIWNDDINVALSIREFE